MLARVTDECQSRGEPLLSSLCVSVQGSVGEQYADVVERVRGDRPEDPDEHASEERLSCYRHWEATGLPRDGGTPLRTAHFKTVRKTTPSRPAARVPGTPRQAAPRKTAAPAAGAQADPALSALLHPGACQRGLRLLRLRPDGFGPDTRCAPRWGRRPSGLDCPLASLPARPPRRLGPPARHRARPQCPRGSRPRPPGSRARSLPPDLRDGRGGSKRSQVPAPGFRRLASRSSQRTTLTTGGAHPLWR